jgi:hypothetical protein
MLGVGPVLRLVRHSFGRFDKPIDWLGALSQSMGEGGSLGEGGMFQAFQAFPSQAEMIVCRNPIMKKLLPFLATVALALFFASCTTSGGPRYPAVKDTFPPLAAGTGRILVYRDALLSPAKMPAVLLNGEQIGLSKAQGFFYVDQPAGDYKVELSGESSPPASFTLSPGQTVYVGIGVHTSIVNAIMINRQYPKVVDATTAEHELLYCRYIGAAQK